MIHVMLVVCKLSSNSVRAAVFAMLLLIYFSVLKCIYTMGDLINILIWDLIFRSIIDNYSVENCVQ